jgi:hypothetical protein
LRLVGASSARIRSFRRINYSLVKAFETASGFSCSHLR